MLSLPIPFASIGSLPPNLLPNSTPEQTVAMLLLNCAQVRRYLTTYGAKDRKLQKKTAHLDDILSQALQTLSEAVREGGGDTIKMR